ncbi:ABC transporter integral membrane type 1 [Penicillium sp. CMV-2018d]|nr:ABC transporter integral membrane type 1 [Penicillium sp. CMV-2018d]
MQWRYEPPSGAPLIESTVKIETWAHDSSIVNFQLSISQPAPRMGIQHHTLPGDSHSSYLNFPVKVNLEI